MALDKKRLSNQIVCLEGTDGRHMALDAGAYLRAARELRATIQFEFGVLPLRAFVFGGLPSVQIMAENIFFDRHHHFADLDGSGCAARALSMTDALLARLRQH